jgi:peptidoglycan/xylan/chitin deacetylase (PgdA/CDA1 family)
MRLTVVRVLVGWTFLAAGCNDVPEVGDGEVFTSRQALDDYGFTDHRAWSQSPPGGLTAAQVPQFVQIGFDDNFRSGLGTTPASGMTWATGFFKSLHNPAGTGNAGTFDGAAVRVSFYSNTTYISDGFVEDPVLVKRSWHTAILDGHETGNHTHTHPDGGAFSVAQWLAEMQTCNDFLTRAFVPNEPAFSIGSGPGLSLASLIGFRSPFLDYNDNTMSALVNLGFTYDISVEEGWQLSDDAVDYNWPYTLDNGSPGGAAVGKPVGKHSGLWELGAAPFALPPALRTQLGLTKITGLDYNLFVSANLTKAQVLSILKYGLDQRLANNRAPFFIGAHTNIYTDSVSLPNSTPQQRREAIEEFVTYALSKPQVRFVTGKDMISWMRQPVALSGSCTAESNTAFCARLGKNCGGVTAPDNCGKSRTVNSCGTCTAPATCGGGGTANVCGTACTAESNAAFCTRLGKNCGAVTAPDNCGKSRTVSSCGTCTAPKTCGGGGAANVCGSGSGTLPVCAPAYAQSNCLSYVQGVKVASAGHNWTCSNGNCANCATFTSCAPGGSGCPWGVVWTDAGACK